MPGLVVAAVISQIVGASPDIRQAELRRLSEAQIASVFSGQAMTYAGEIQLLGYAGVFCPDGTYGMPRDRVQPERGVYSISENAIVIEVRQPDGRRIRSFALRVFGDADGRVFVTQGDARLTEVRFETPVAGWCA
jgi:hypothetical protein